MIEIEEQQTNGINTIPILRGNCLLCIFSIILNIIEIKIILSLKFLKSILYRLLYLISISEIINCVIHIVQSILIIYDINQKALYIIISIIIYFTDTFFLVLLVCLCDAMNTMILKQNKQISSNKTYKYISLIIALLLTILYCLFLFGIIKNKNNNLYLNLISWKFISNEDIFNYGNIFEYFSYYITIIIYFIIIVYSFVLISKIWFFIKEKSQDESRPKNWAKLNEFIIKMLKYPAYGALWVFPHIFYSLFEISKKTKDDINIIRWKYFLYFIYTFISSIRGILFFKLFISNERIKKYIQSKIQNITFFQSIINDDINKYLVENKKNSITNNLIELGGTKNSLLKEGLLEEKDMKINNVDSNENDEDRNDYDDDSSSISSKNKENSNNQALLGRDKNVQILSNQNEKDED